ncbi:uncharacterized protein LOC126794776 [Argentina anserina]|uniref:uncharacterized protein LOC126794776 n=1 Tax=Argentina anserina TaxID=57926 RepID=UPI00217620DB|nr:uncharacterized protein LOC126794776 [Potentilla anserina]
MEPFSSPPSDSNPTASGASISLQNLPSRGLFSAPVLSLNPGRMRVCVCEYETSLPEDEHIKTNQQNILIRSLKLKKQKEKVDSSSKDMKVAGAAEGLRKRVAERGLDHRAPAKKATMQPRLEESSSQAANRDFQGLTVERLRALLKAKGLSVKGKKDELIARLRSSSG